MLGRRRRLISYLTAPIGFIPFIGNLAQLVGQEIADSIMEKEAMRRYRWFYMLTDLADEATERL
jgi:hypothetical protein